MPILPMASARAGQRPAVRAQQAHRVSDLGHRLGSLAGKDGPGGLGSRLASEWLDGTDTAFLQRVTPHPHPPASPPRPPQPRHPAEQIEPERRPERYGCGSEQPPERMRDPTPHTPVRDTLPTKRKRLENIVAHPERVSCLRCAFRRYQPETRFMPSSNQAAISWRRSATVSAPAWLSARSAGPSTESSLTLSTSAAAWSFPSRPKRRG